MRYSDLSPTTPKNQVTFLPRRTLASPQPHPDDVTWRMRLRKLLNTTTVDILTGGVQGFQ